MAVITVRAKDLTVAPIWATPYLGLGVECAPESVNLSPNDLMINRGGED